VQLPDLMFVRTENPPYNWSGSREADETAGCFIESGSVTRPRCTS